MVCRFEIDKISETRKIYGMSISNRHNVHDHIRNVDFKSTKSPLPYKVCRFQIDKFSYISK